MTLNSLMLDHGFAISFFAIMGIFTTRALVVAGGAMCWMNSFEWPKRHKVVLPAQEKIDLGRDLQRGLSILAVDAATFALLLQTGVFKAHLNASVAGLLVTFAVMFVWMEIYFYFSHRALHRPGLYHIHRFHHEGRGTNPWTSLAFSYSERAVLLFGSFVPAAVISHFLPVSLDGFALYFLLNYLLNVYGHLNVEIAPGWFRKSFLFRMINTSVSHGMHHLRYRGNYGLFTPFLDDAFGTSFKDYPEKFDRVTRGYGAL
jgi:lathosterol oxidase